MADKKYGIFRIEKIKLSDGGEIMNRLKHAYREFKNTSFDPELSQENFAYFRSSSKDVMQVYKDRINSITTDSYKPAKNSVGIYECILTSTAGAIPKEKERDFFDKSYHQLCKIFGKDNVLEGVVHYDETTPHSHWYITPIFDTTTVLRRTRAEKKNGTCRTITRPQLNATHWTGSPALLSKLQDEIWEGVFKHFGLARGEIEDIQEKVSKKKNIRSDLKKRDIALTRREQRLEQQEKLQKKRSEILAEKENILDQEMKSASQSALKEYEDMKGSAGSNDFNFPELPLPSENENAWHYHLKIKPIFDAVVSLARQFMKTISNLKKEHHKEVQLLNTKHESELADVKATAELEKNKAVEKERSKGEKWYNILYKHFSVKIGNKTIKVNQGLTDAYYEKSNQLAEWESKNGDELISLGTQYKQCRAHNWNEYTKVNSKKNQSIDYDFER